MKVKRLFQMSEIVLLQYEALAMFLSCPCLSGVCMQA